MGLRPPGEFIPVAEQTGLIRRIDKWVLRQACSQVQSWREEGLLPFRLAVNTSAPDLTDDLSASVRDIASETGFPPQDLDIEITERTLGEDDAISHEILADLKRLGVRIAIDDFGVDYSSLSRLRSFPVDVLKIDRTFVHDLEYEGRVMAPSLVALAHNLGVEVVAEGVETPRQLARLKEAGCMLAPATFWRRQLRPRSFGSGCSWVPGAPRFKGEASPASDSNR